MVLPGLIHPQTSAPVATGCTEQVLREVVLHGALRREFGDRYEITSNSPVLALNGLMTMIPGLYTRIAQGEFILVVGRRKTGRRVEDVADLARGWQPGERTLHVVPAVKGRGGRGGMTKVIIGVAIIALAIAAPYAAFGFAGPILSGAGTAGALSFGVFGGLGATAIGGITFGTLAGLGAIVALGGVAQMLSPQPKTPAGGREAPGENPSLVFNSVVNSIEEGNVVPLVYGDVLCGSQVIAAGITPEDSN